MANNIVTVSGMFGKVDNNIHTYFADSPVVVNISGLEWPRNETTHELTSPFNIVRVEVVYKKPVTEGQDELVKVGDFQSDTGGQSSISFDISTALKAIWSDYEYTEEVEQARLAALNLLDVLNTGSAERDMRVYILRISTEYIASDGVFTTTQCVDEDGNTDIPGGQCLMGGWTEWERSLIDNPANADVSALEHTGLRNGDASTKPTSSPERVGSTSITSWVDVGEKEITVDGVTQRIGYTKSIFYPANVTPADDDTPRSKQGWTGHAPIVIRDSVAYIDFLFINRRGAVETCSGMTKESMNISTETKQYSRTDGPAFQPKRSLMAIGSDGRRSWQMSSGYVTREWAEWWTMEFLNGKRKQWWMRYSYTAIEKGMKVMREKFVPVTIKPAKNDISIYDRTKQQMPHVDFTVTLALEG